MGGADSDKVSAPLFSEIRCERLGLRSVNGMPPFSWAKCVRVVGRSLNPEMGERNCHEAPKKFWSCPYFTGHCSNLF